jgi:hypothetical protein
MVEFVPPRDVIRAGEHVARGAMRAGSFEHVDATSHVALHVLPGDVGRATASKVDDGVDALEGAGDRAGPADVASADATPPVGLTVDPRQRVLIGEALPEDAADQPTCAQN